ncbi:MFS transporter, partial [bacterium]|nr:MFS transporter [bacterium]
MKNQNHQKIIHAWCMYDWAMSAFHTTVMAAFVPIFFRHVATMTLSDAQNNLATSLWGYTTAIAMLIVAILSLVLGPVADYGSSKKRFLAFFIGLGVISTSLLTFSGPGDWLWVALLFILGNIGVACGEVFYDALLPHIAGPDEMDRVSTRGYAVGYVGGGLLLIINLGMIYFLPKTIILSGQEPVPLLGMKLSFLSVAIWWGIFSVPLFRYVSEPKGMQISLAGENPLQVAIHRLSTTFSEIRQYKPLLLFIIAFWLYNDGIGTIIKMAIAFGDEIGIGTMDLVGALLLTQIIGIPSTLGFGKLAKRMGVKKAILLGLGVYVG